MKNKKRSTKFAIIYSGKELTLSYQCNPSEQIKRKFLALLASILSLISIGFNAWSIQPNQPPKLPLQVEKKDEEIDN